MLQDRIEPSYVKTNTLGDFGFAHSMKRKEVVELMMDESLIFMGFLDYIKVEVFPLGVWEKGWWCYVHSTWTRKRKVIPQSLLIGELMVFVLPLITEARTRSL